MEVMGLSRGGVARQVPHHHADAGWKSVKRQTGRVEQQRQQRLTRFGKMCTMNRGGRAQAHSVRVEKLYSYPRVPHYGAGDIDHRRRRGRGWVTMTWCESQSSHRGDGGVGGGSDIIVVEVDGDERQTTQIKKDLNGYGGGKEIRNGTHLRKTQSATNGASYHRQKREKYKYRHYQKHRRKENSNATLISPGPVQKLYKILHRCSSSEDVARIARGTLILNNENSALRNGNDNGVFPASEGESLSTQTSDDEDDNNVVDDEVMEMEMNGKIDADQEYIHRDLIVQLLCEHDLIDLLFEIITHNGAHNFMNSEAIKPMYGPTFCIVAKHLAARENDFSRFRELLTILETVIRMRSMEDERERVLNAIMMNTCVKGMCVDF